MGAGGRKYQHSPVGASTVPTKGGAANVAITVLVIAAIVIWGYFLLMVFSHSM